VTNNTLSKKIDFLEQRLKKVDVLEDKLDRLLDAISKK
jgi:hypothetical protein